MSTQKTPAANAWKSNDLVGLGKTGQKIRNIIYPLILLIWPLAACNQGVSIMDTTYSLSNFRFPESIGSMWRFATFLANEAGTAFIRSPFGQTMLGMNVMCSLVISLTAIIAFFVLKKNTQDGIVFTGEVIAIGFCWCPSVILYNYLTYFFLTIGSLLLYKAVEADNAEDHKLSKKAAALYAAAGLALGINVMVRFANLAEAALIIALWFWCFLTKKKFGEAAARTGLCIAGFVLGFLIGYGISAVIYGPGAFFAMIPELLNSTQSVQSYTFGGMLMSIVSAYLHSLRWFVLAAVCAAAGVVFFRLPFIKGNVRKVCKVLYCGAILVLVRLFYGRGMFNFGYQDYGSMFEWGMLLTILTLILCSLGAAGVLLSTPQHRFTACMAVITILILPLGSNNYTYPVLNCMFITAPYAIYLFVMAARRASLAKNKYIRRTAFAWTSMICMIILGALIQGSIFHVKFAFRDGVDGTTRSARFEADGRLKGMYTTEKNHEELTALMEELENYSEDYKARGAVVFGNAPGIHYIADLSPAIDTAWPDLDSYPTQRFEEQLEALTTGGADEENKVAEAAEKVGTEAACPLVIIHKEESAQSASSQEKREVLDDYLKRNHYELMADVPGYEIYAAEAAE